MTPSLAALDLTNLGTRIGDRPLKEFKDPTTGGTVRLPLAPSTLSRAERCRQKFSQYPAMLMPAKGNHGTERHPFQPLATQTSQQETALLTTGSVFAAHRHNGDGKHISKPMGTVTSTHELAVMLAVNNYQRKPHSAVEPPPAQPAAATPGLLTAAGLVRFRQNTIPSTHGEPMPTVTSDQIPGLLTTQVPQSQADQPSGAVHTAAAGQGQLLTGWHTQNNGMLVPEWSQALANVALEDCYFRMLGKHEVGRGCGFDTDYPGHKGSFVGPQGQLRGLGQCPTPGQRLRQRRATRDRDLDRTTTPRRAACAGIAWCVTGPPLGTPAHDRRLACQPVLKLQPPPAVSSNRSPEPPLTTKKNTPCLPTDRRAGLRHVTTVIALKERGIDEQHFLPIAHRSYCQPPPRSMLV